MSEEKFKKKYIKYKSKYIKIKNQIGGDISFTNNRKKLIENLKRSSRWSYDHSERVSWLCSIISREYKNDNKFIKLATEGGLFHDVGKECVNKDILNSTVSKFDKSFSKEDQDKIQKEMEKHPECTKKILEKYYYKNEYICDNNLCNKKLPTICGDHHEKLDGSGYPSNKQNNNKNNICDQICIITQIITVCDIYDAIRSSRPYEPSNDHKTTIEIMKKMGNKINQDIVLILEKTYIPEIWIYNYDKKLSLIEHT